jgi:type IV secretory pathway VirB4 component
MNEDDVRLYMHENNEKIPAELGIEKMPEKLKDLIARGKTNVIYEEILKDAGHNYQRIDRILEGEFGKVFGGTQSIARKLQQRVVVKDYSGLNITSVALMQQFMWRLRNSAQLRGDRRFMFQVSVHDENYKMMRVEGYPEALTDAMKQGRGNDELIILASHRIRDYWSVGGPESLQRQMATNIFSDIDLLIVGKQNKKDLNDLETLVEITQLERNVIMAQTRGQFAVKIGTEPWFFIETDSTFTEIKERITRSNGALENALNRSIVVEDEFVQLSDEELETEEALV